MGKIVLRLDRMMVDRKMSLNELAERVGISNVNLSKIKNNKVTAIRFSTLAAICEVLDCEAGDILEFQRVGAYAMCEGISLFLSRDLPSIYLYSKQNGLCLQRSRFETNILNYKGE